VPGNRYPYRDPVNTRLTLDSGQKGGPVWSPDGREIAFHSNRRGSHDVFVMPSDGSGEAELVFATEGNDMPMSWSPDGRTLYCISSDLLVFVAGRLSHVNRQPGGGWSEPFASFFGEELIGPAEISPDNRFLAYASDKSGIWEVYVASLPDGKGKWQVSTAGGSQPCWSRDGKELFYVRGDTLLTVPVPATPAFSAGIPEPLFSDPNLVDRRIYRRYDVSKDGQRFVTMEPIWQSGSGIGIIQNWSAEFRDREEK
jgi:eukaryotic-like serine/threonine-protein kinase